MTTPITIRASSWAELFDCSLRWYAKNVLQIRRPSSAPAHIGTSIHHATALYDSHRISGDAITHADAAQEYLAALREPTYDVDWGDASQKAAANDGVAATVAYCRDVADQRNYLAVEAPFTPLDVEVEGVTIRLTGTMDRARVSADGESRGISDVKTGARVVSQGRVDTKGRGPQLAVYEVLWDHTHPESPITAPAEIIAVPVVQNPVVLTATVPNARDVLLGTPESPGLMEMAGKMLKAGLFPPNPQSRLCSERYCPYWDKCRYHE